MKAKLILAAVIMGIPTAAYAADYPEIKAGLWEVEVNVDGQSQGKIKQCVDSNTAQDMLNAGQKMMGKACSEVKTSKDGGSYTSTVSCQLGGSKMDSKTTLSGDFSREYTSETTTNFNPPMMGQGQSVSKSVGKWLSACEAGQRPGDTVMPDGRKVNVLDMMKSMPDLSQMPAVQGNAEAGAIDLEKLKEQMPNLEELQKSMPSGQ